MIDSSLCGSSFEVSHHVTEGDSAERFGNEGVPVFATPVICALVEEAAIGVLRPHLGPGAVSVGTDIRVRHTAPTPLAGSMSVKATLSTVENGALLFDVVAHDGHEQVATAVHERRVVDADRLLRRANRKLESAAK